MRKWLAMVMVLTLLCTAASAMADPVRLGIVTPDADHGFTAESIVHARAELEAQQGLLGEEAFAYRYEVGADVQTQTAAIDDLLAWGADVVLLWPIDGEPMRAAAETILAQDVGLILYDRLIDGLAGLDAEMMGDNETIGTWMGQYILTHFEDALSAGEAVHYLMFVGDASTVTDQRGGNMLAAFGASPYAAQLEPLADPFVTLWSGDTAEAQLAAWLQSATTEDIEAVDLIVTHDDEIVDGVLRALQAHGDAHNIRLVTGVGARRETLDAFDSHPLGLDLVTYFFSPSYIRQAVRLAVADAFALPYNSHPVVGGRRFLTATYEVTPDNVDAFRQSEMYLERYSVDE